MSRLTAPAIVLLGAAISALLGRLTIPDALYGWDAYPLIAAARFESIGAFFGTFTEELMDGRYPDGSFYRPVLHLMLGLEYAISGLEPSTFGIVDAAVAVLAALFVALCATRLGAPRIAAGLAGAFVLLNPAADHVTWFMPRRPESLVVLFTSATLCAQLRPDEAGRPGKPHRSRIALSFLLALLASSSKETGILVLPLVLLLHALERGAKGALRASAPVAAAVLLFVAVRTAVLGGLGGHPESSLTNVADVFSHVRSQFALVLGLSGATLALATVPIALAAAFGVARKDTRVATLVPLVWLLGNLALSAVSGVQRPWYAYQILAPVALIAAAGSTVRGPRLALHLAVGVVLFLPLARSSVASNRSAIDQSAHRFLVSFADATLAARPGNMIVVEGFSTIASSPRINLFLHAPYSLEAYAELIGAPPTQCALPHERPTPTRGVVTVVLSGDGS